MAFGAGLALIVVGGLLGALVQLAALRRPVTAPALATLGVCGAAVGAGGLLVQDDAGAGSWALTLLFLGGLVPLHAWLLMGRRRSLR